MFVRGALPMPVCGVEVEIRFPHWQQRILGQRDDPYPSPALGHGVGAVTVDRVNLLSSLSLEMSIRASVKHSPSVARSFSVSPTILFLPLTSAAGRCPAGQGFPVVTGGAAPSAAEMKSPALKIGICMSWKVSVSP